MKKLVADSKSDRCDWSLPQLPHYHRHDQFNHYERQQHRLDHVDFEDGFRGDKCFWSICGSAFHRFQASACAVLTTLKQEKDCFVELRITSNAISLQDSADFDVAYNVLEKAKQTVAVAKASHVQYTTWVLLRDQAVGMPGQVLPDGAPSLADVVAFPCFDLTLSMSSAAHNVPMTLPRDEDAEEDSVNPDPSSLSCRKLGEIIAKRVVSALQSSSGAASIPNSAISAIRSPPVFIGVPGLAATVVTVQAYFDQAVQRLGLMQCKPSMILVAVPEGLSYAPVLGSSVQKLEQNRLSVLLNVCCEYVVLQRELARLESGLFQGKRDDHETSADSEIKRRRFRRFDGSLGDIKTDVEPSKKGKHVSDLYLSPVVPIEGFVI